MEGGDSISGTFNYFVPEVGVETMEQSLLTVISPLSCLCLGACKTSL